MELEIIANSDIADADGNVSWEVDIFASGTRVGSRVSLQDPLDKDGRSLCRWYFDTYRENPFETTKAKSATSLLEDYGLRLTEQLRLGDYIEGNSDVVIRIKDGHKHGCNSIHRLYWEFLEDCPAARNSSITVERLAPLVSDGPLQVRGDDEEAPAAPRQTNILLVTSRHLGLDARDEDINPSLVCDLLWDIKSRLDADSQCVTDLNIEILRPASVASLQTRLKQRESRFFDVVHLDMHGAVEAHGDDGKTAGVLHFNDQESDATTSIAADDVASILHKYGVHTVVLNACDSANAAFGDNGNTAQTFVSAGIENVVAMAHKASESAVSSFFQVFYTGLLVNGRDFRESARIARAHLRTNSRRNTRFHLQADIADWVIPVLYTSGRPSRVPRAFHDGHNLPAHPHLSNYQAMSQTQDVVVGRDLDCLRVERALAEKDAVYLYGPVGIGKTAFLRHLAQIWRRSTNNSYAFCINAQSSANPLAELANQMVEQAEAEATTSCTTLHAEADKILQFLSGRRILLILDGLAQLDPSMGSKLSQFAELLDLLKTTLTRPAIRGTDGQVFIVASGRTRTLPDFMTSRLQWTEHELGGLHTPDSLQVIRRVLGKDGAEEMQKMGKAEPWIHLLQGNPAALIQFVRLSDAAGISLRAQYDALHGENPILSLDIAMLRQSSPFLVEFLEVVSRLPEEWLAVWIMLAWFWHDGPPVSDFAALLTEVDIIQKGHEDSVSDAVQEACRLGYVKCDSEGRVCWIHVLFTIFARVVACSSACRVDLPPPQDPALAFRRRFSSQTMGHLVTNDSWALSWPSRPVCGLEYAARLTATSLSSHWARDQNEKYWSFLLRFLSLLDKSSATVFDRVLQGDFKREVQQFCAPHRENYLSALKLSRGRGPLPLPVIAWPRSMIALGHFILQRCSAEMASIVAGYLEELLSGAVLYSKFSGGGEAVKQEDIPTIVQLICWIIETYRRHIPSGEARAKELIQLGRSIIEESEKRFGTSTEWNISMSKGLLSFVAAGVLIEDRRVGEARNEMNRALELLRIASQNTDRTQLETFLGSKTAEEAARWGNFFQDVGSGLNKFDELWKMAEAEATGNGVRSKTGRQRGPRISAAGHPFLEWISLIVRSGPRIASPTHKLKLYENEMEKGNWSRMIGLHGSLAAQGLAGLNFDQVWEQLGFQEAIANRNGAEGELRDRIQKAKGATATLQKVLSSIASGNLTDDDFEALQGIFTEAAKVGGVDVSGAMEINDIVRESLVRHNDPSLPHNSAPGILGGDDSGDVMGKIRELFGQLPQVLGNRDLLQTILSRKAKVLRTLRNLEYAEDASDETAIYKHLDELQSLSEDKDYQGQLKQGGVAKRRDWNTRRLLHGLSTALQPLAMTIKENPQPREVQTVLTKARNISSLSGCTGEVKDVADEVETLLEGVYFVSLVKAADFVREGQGDNKEFIRLASGILEMFRAGEFRRAMENKGNQDVLNEVWNQQFYARAKFALRGNRWAEGRRIYEEWRGHKELWDVIVATAGKEDDLECAKILDLECIFLRYASVEGVWEALLRLDLEMVNSRLGEARRFHGRGRPGSRVEADTEMLKMTERMVERVVRMLPGCGPVITRMTVEMSMAMLRDQGCFFQGG